MTFNIGEQPAAAVLNEPADYANKARLDLLYEVGKKVGSVSHLKQLVEHITQMTQYTLNAAASSVLLVSDQDEELFFEVAVGSAGKVLRQIRVSTKSGITGWVVRNGKPVIINDVTKDQRFNQGLDEMTGFVTKSIICAPLVVGRKIIGVIEVLNKLNGSDFNEQDLSALVSVASTAAISIENTRLHQTVLDAYKSTIKALAAALDAKDPYTHGHSQRVTEYALLGATSLLIPANDLEDLEYAGILHDIGKIAVADSILNKSGSLTTKEWAIMREHPLTGANILREIPFLEKASELVHHHHERYDGTGYPDGLKGEEISIGARLLAVADAFDTMTTDRSYRAAMTINSSINELYLCSGTQFCPVVVESFVSAYRKRQELLTQTNYAAPATR